MRNSILFFITGCIYCSLVFSGNGPGKKPVPAKFLTKDGTENPIPRKTVHNPGLHSNAYRIPAQGDSIGFTYYDYPTNGCSKSNIFVFETGEIYVIRMALNNELANATNMRGTYVKFYNGSNWSSGWNRVEGTPTGFTDGGVFDDGSGWAMASPGIFSRDTSFGAMQWISRPPNFNTGLWPVAASVGNDTVFVVSSLTGTGPLADMIFIRSFDGGTTWSNPYRIDSAVTNPSSAELRTAEGYHITAFHNHVSAVQVSATITGGGYYGEVNLYESHDYGTTWTRRTINPAFTEPINLGSVVKEERPFLDPYAAYDANGQLHVLWSTLTRWVDTTNGYNGWYNTDDNKIVHWSDASGLSTVATLPAGTANANIANNDVNLGFLGMPSCAFDGTGNMYVVYQQVSALADSDAAGNAYYQIYGVGSPDNGDHWNTTPVNLTNSTGYDNMGVNVAPFIRSDNKIYIVFNSDIYTGNALQGSQTENIPVAIKVYGFDKTTIPTTIGVVDNEPVANNFTLKQNYPNPFNPNTTISYDLRKDSKVSLKIFNMLGQEVRTLVNSRQAAGTDYKVQWDGRDNSGNAVSSGLYLYRMESGGQSITKKMIMLK